MNKNIIIAVVVVLAAGAAYFLWGSGGSINTAQDAASIKELIARGENLTCTFSRADEGNSMDGTIYVSGGKVRGDFSLIQDGQSFESHMIQDADFAYVWNTGGPLGAAGFKMSVSADEEVSSGEGEYQAVDLEEQLDTKCSRWSPDASKFVPPSNITFQDLSQQAIQINQSAEGDVQVQQCAACNMAPDEATKAQCLTALGCN
ncbi:MAG: hypothetical protein PHV43_01545 [Candidatus Colwellbacteria bacterium]|nr:hypothetical protein [Candidatus Colwellbacteria bacterium]